MTTYKTQPFDDQKPGTSGLRKKVRRFQDEHYLANFVQSIFNAVGPAHRKQLVVGGDGRFFNREATQTILKMAAANGFQRVVVGCDGLLSTPAASNLIRRIGADGGIILSASHNPAGPEQDFGIKFNNANGSPAPEGLSESIYQNTLSIDEFRMAEVDDIPLDKTGVYGIDEMEVQVVDPVEAYEQTMSKCFDFDLLRDAFKNDRLSICFDAMHAVTGPYAKQILERTLGARCGSVINGEPLDDFGGGHPDPNLVHAGELVSFMQRSDAPVIGAASDGDGDRNLILGQSAFVTPSDSLAILTRWAHLLPQFKDGLAGVARSMPTSRAVDRVAESIGIDYYETPTGWKFFGNLLDAGLINICGEESFGTGGDHVREKDGLWTVLAWLSIVVNRKLSVAELCREHWREYGRHFYCRHDFEGLDLDQANNLIEALKNQLPTLKGECFGDYRVIQADEFAYVDPVDHTESSSQGIRILFDGGSRLVYRLSGTGTSGATLRVYIERYDTSSLEGNAIVSNRELAGLAAEIAQIEGFTGRTEASVVT